MKKSKEVKVKKYAKSEKILHEKSFLQYEIRD